MDNFNEIHRKYSRLLDSLCSLESAILAFSGGVDSTFLLAALQESGIRFLAVTGVSPTMPARDRKDVESLVHDLGIRQHRMIESGEINDKNFVKNPSDRCYFCKSNLFDKLTVLAKVEGFAAVLDGSTVDDLNDYRPGMRAKEQFRIRSPILEAGLHKEEVRRLSREKGLKTWDKPLAKLSNIVLRCLGDMSQDTVIYDRLSGVLIVSKKGTMCCCALGSDQP